MSSVPRSGPPSSGGSDGGTAGGQPPTQPSRALSASPGPVAPPPKQPYAGPVNLFVSKHAPARPETIIRGPIKQHFSDLRKHIGSRAVPPPSVARAAVSPEPATSQPSSTSGENTTNKQTPIPQQATITQQTSSATMAIAQAPENERPIAPSAVGGKAPPIYKHSMSLLEMMREAVKADGPQASAAIQKLEGQWTELENMYRAIDTGSSQTVVKKTEKDDLAPVVKKQDNMASPDQELALPSTTVDRHEPTTREQMQALRDRMQAAQADIDRYTQASSTKAINPRVKKSPGPAREEKSSVPELEEGEIDEAALKEENMFKGAKQELDQKTLALEKANAQVTALAKEKQALVHQVNILTLEKEALAKEKETLTEAVQKGQDGLGKQNRSLTEAIGKEAQKADAFRETAQVAQAALQAVKQEFEHLQKTHMELKPKFTQLSAEYAQVYKDSGKLKIEISALKAENSALKEQLKGLRELETLNKALKSKNTELENESKTHQEELAAAHKERSEASDAKEKFQKETVKLHIKMKTFEEENSKIKAALEKAELELDNAKGQCDKLQREKGELDVNHKKLISNYAALRAQGVAGSGPISNEDVPALKEKLKTLQEEMDQKAKEIKEWMTFGKEAFDKYNSIRGDRDTFKQTLSAEIAGLKETVKNLQQNQAAPNGDGGIDWKTKYEDLLRKVQRGQV